MGLFPCSLKATRHPVFQPSSPFDNTRLLLPRCQRGLFPRWFCSLPSPLVPNTWINGAYFGSPSRPSLSLSLSFFRCSFHFVILTQPLRESGCNEARLYIHGQIRAWRMRRFTWTVWNASMQECEDSLGQECLDFSPPGNKGRARLFRWAACGEKERKRDGDLSTLTSLPPPCWICSLRLVTCTFERDARPFLHLIKDPPLHFWLGFFFLFRFLR